MTKKGARHDSFESQWERGRGLGTPLYGTIKASALPCRDCGREVPDPTDVYCHRCRWMRDLAVRKRQEEAMFRAKRVPLA